MATYTENLNLKKPAAEDFYNINDFNGNADIIDALAGAGRTTETVKGNADELASHIVDNTKHIPYLPTTHSGNAYSVTVPELTELTDGYGLY